MLAPWKKRDDKPRQHIKKQRHHFADKGPSIQNYGFSSNHVWMWKLDYKEDWVPKNWCFWNVDAGWWRRLLRVPWTARRSNQPNPKGNKPWIFIGSTDAEAETPILQPLNVKSQLTGKEPDAGKGWGQVEKAVQRMTGWHYRLNGHEFEQTQEDNEGQWSLACCSPRGHRVGHDWVTEQQQGISSVQSLSSVQFFATPWTAARQASLSITNSWSLQQGIPPNKYNVIPIKTSMTNFKEMEKPILKHIWSFKEPQVAKTILKKNKDGGLTFPDF